MNIFNDFMSNYGATILYAIVTAITGYIGLFIKRVFGELLNNETVSKVVNTCVRAVEQIYKDIHGEEKLAKCLENVSQILNEKGITVSESQLRLLIEAAVEEMNAAVNGKTDTDIKN